MTIERYKYLILISIKNILSFKSMITSLINIVIKSTIGIGSKWEAPLVRVEENFADVGRCTIFLYSEMRVENGNGNVIKGGVHSKSLKASTINKSSHSWVLSLSSLIPPTRLGQHTVTLWQTLFAQIALQCHFISVRFLARVLLTHISFCSILFSNCYWRMNEARSFGWKSRARQSLIRRLWRFSRCASTAFSH